MRTPTPSPSIPYRIGFGYDIHRLGEGRALVLGGVRIPFDRGLVGHSDADVLLHAICDALLGAAALGDIGRHFPDTDKRFLNISSLRLLKQVAQLLKEHHYGVQNVDATVVLERPKIAPFVPRMTKNIASALGLNSSSVSVKATTNEGLGSLGSGDGCAAFAVASLFRPTER